MKYLFWLLVILVAVWAIRRGRKVPHTPTSTSAATPSPMVTCAHCGIHLPHEDAVTGRQGLYCSTEHRAAAQDRNPD